ncbi:hypothetical protein V8G54_021523 [Vigna mungo]|uniref:Thioredoxin domain-containing protein n=1 Tax=Vigna mungo TaxID=3915 RepID=A0AAQ3RVU5_VIGMU
MAGGANFMQRVLSYVVNQSSEILPGNRLLSGYAIEDGYPNPVSNLKVFYSFQRFAVRTSKRIEDISSKAIQKRQEIIEQVKDISEDISEHVIPVMASMVSTKANQFRYSTRLLFSRFLRHGRPSTLSTPFSPHLQLLHHPYQARNQGFGNGSLGLCQRFLSSSAVNPISWLSFVLLVLTGAGLVFYYDREKKRHIEEIRSNTEAVKQGPSVGKAAIGGPFRLINHQGKHVTEKDFLGKWTLLYFGFTHCPDICPDELQKLAAAVDKIKEKGGIETVPVFISVDPERDTVEQVGEYVKEFHPKLIGLTGSPDEIKNVARAYRVYYMKTAEEDSDYLVDHSIVIYLMSPDMEFVKFFGKNNDVDSLTDGVIKEMLTISNNNDVVVVMKGTLQHEYAFVVNDCHASMCDGGDAANNGITMADDVEEDGVFEACFVDLRA